MKIFYAYLWLRHSGQPYYVGKGHGRRAYKHHSVVRCPTELKRIIVQEFLSEEDAFIAERFFISYYGRLDLDTGILMNRTDGGEGHANPSLKERRRRSLLLKGIPKTEEACRNMSKSQQGPRPWMRGRKRRPETCERIRQRAIGRKPSSETKQKMSLAHIGKKLPRDADYCAKRSEIAKAIQYPRNTNGTFVKGIKRPKIEQIA